MKFFTAFLIVATIATQGLAGITYARDAAADASTSIDTTATGTTTDTADSTAAVTGTESTNSTEATNGSWSVGLSDGSEAAAMTSSASGSESGSGGSSPNVGDWSGSNAAVSLQSITFVASAIVATAATALF
ncbi:hypothetical protein PRIC2_012706 [Phytophthora ramorum]|uniref:uncharacterized protein n=1 Tax=Phytophthora ramorum TaxID=164328 RepID=UPI00309DC2BA|nr:hypothetical protein KRP23_9002 [Phytophthora ramorum]